MKKELEEFKKDATKRYNEWPEKQNGQKELKVRIKKLHPDAVIPKYAHDADCGMDLTAVNKEYDNYGNVVYGFGLAFEIPKGYAGFIFPRSSNYKTGLLLSNCVGIVDSCYRGEVMAKFSMLKSNVVPARLLDRIRWFIKGHFDRNVPMNGNYCGLGSYNVGDRVAQMVILPYPKVTFEEVDELSETDRGDGGYGSTGN